MIKNFLIFFVFSFCILSCGGGEKASTEESPKGFSCQCEKDGSVQTLNASSVKEAQNSCDAEGGKIKKCSKNK